MITILQSAQFIAPVFNDVVYLVSSDNVAQTNFKYVLDVTIGSATRRLFAPPNPNNLNGLFNIGSILESYVANDIDTTLTDDNIEQCPNNLITYTVSFGESYGDPETIFDNLISTSVLAWNGVYDYEEFCDYSSGDINASTATPSQFLTNKPTSGDIEMDDNAWLYWLNYSISPINKRIRVITYDSNNAVIDTRIISTAASGYSFRVPTGPNNLNNISNSNIVSGGLQPIITASVAKYTAQLVNNSNVPMTELYSYTVSSSCSEHEKHRIIFLNKLGGYDQFNFTLASKSTSDIERSMYKKGLGNYTNSGANFTYSKSDRAHTTYYTRVKDKFTITSDWVSEEVYEWLYELITSPDAYLDNGDVLIPINISNSSYESKKTLTNKLFNVTLEYTLSYDRYRQRM